MVVTIAVLLLKFGIFSNAYQYQSDQVLTIYFEDDSDGLYPGNGNVTWTNQVLFSPPLLTDRVPSLAAYSSIHLLIKRSNQGLNLSNTNDRRECRKQNTTMLLLLILLGGDVQMNPGPNKYPCGICDRPVAKNHRGLECDECGYWVHIKCGDVTSTDYELLLLKEQFTWICPRCAIPNFSDSFFDESNLADANLFDSLSDLDTSMEAALENADQPHTSSPKSKNPEPQKNQTNDKV